MNRSLFSGIGALAAAMSLAAFSLYPEADYLEKPRRPEREPKPRRTFQMKVTGDLLAEDAKPKSKRAKRRAVARAR